MALIKEPITELIFSSRYSDAYDDLLAKLMELPVTIEENDKKKGKIIVCCIDDSFNMILWKCVIDKLLFKVNQIEPNKTKINIFGLPNLFKIKVSGEDTVSVVSILDHIKQ